MIKSIRRLEFSMGGYSATNYFCNYKEGATEFARSAYPSGIYGNLEVKAIETTRNQLEKLAKVLHQIEFLQWEGMYWADVLDGVEWQVLLVYNGNLKKRVAGFNAYPDRKGKSELEWSPDFKTFIDALETLMDSPGFFSKH